MTGDGKGTSAMHDAFATTVRAAVRDANVPTLLMVLVQLTGDRRWLEAPYRPTRGRGLDENDTGGLPEQVQDEIRRAAADAIVAWRHGKPVALPDPGEDLLTRMLSVAMGESVPAEYGPMIADDLGIATRGEDPVHETAAPAGFSAIVVGAGISGLLAAHRLGAAGVECTVVEKDDRVGGTWWHNRYPGCGVDVPSHLYSYSTVVADWPRYYASRDQLHDYLEDVADQWRLRERIRLSTVVLSAAWDSSANVDCRGRRTARTGNAPRQHLDQRGRRVRHAEAPGPARAGRFRRGVVPHRAVAGRARPRGKTSRRDRQRSERHAGGARDQPARPRR